MSMSHEPFFPGRLHALHTLLVGRAHAVRHDQIADQLAFDVFELIAKRAFRCGVEVDHMP